MALVYFSFYRVYLRSTVLLQRCSLCWQQLQGYSWITNWPHIATHLVLLLAGWLFFSLAKCYAYLCKHVKSCSKLTKWDIFETQCRQLNAHWLDKIDRMDKPESLVINSGRFRWFGHVERNTPITTTIKLTIKHKISCTQQIQENVHAQNYAVCCSAVANDTTAFIGWIFIR